MLVCASAPPARACSVFAEPITQKAQDKREFRQADEILLVRLDRLDADDRGADRSASFAVLRRFKGEVAGTFDLRLGIGLMGCGPDWEQGGHYVLFLSRAVDGTREFSPGSVQVAPDAPVDADLFLRLQALADKSSRH